MSFFEAWFSQSGGVTERHRQLMATFLASLHDVENIDISNLDNKMLNLCKSLDRFWKNVSRKKTAFLARYSDWLNEIECVELAKSTEKCIQEDENKPGPYRGRPRKSFDVLSSRSKRRRLADLSQVDDSAVSTLLNMSGGCNTTFQPASAEKVLSVVVEAKLTKHQYLLIRNFINSITGCNILPSYQALLNAKKKCYPDNLTITDCKAEVELQNLLDHTAGRILEVQKDVLDKVPTNATNCLTLIGKWGFDGSTGQSEYKQRFSDSSGSDDSDSSLFVTSYVPLQLIANTPLDNIVIWKNPRPASTRYCRPVRFQFLKESTELSKKEEAYFKEKINNLTPSSFSFNNHDFLIQHSLQLTMVDGKVCTALSESSSCKCYICGATPKEMNKIDVCLNKQPDESRYEFGLSPLHSWIRFFEYFVHLSYRMDIKKWQVRSENEKRQVADRKLKIQNEFRVKLGLIVDKPRSGGSGTSNDGNTARKFFSKSKVSAEITGLRQDLIDRCSTILQVLSSGFNIDFEKFNNYALETARLLVQEYPWYNLPASVHKILIHGSEVAKNALLSIGELSEEAAESNNKHYKAFRRDHTRKMSRQLTNTDLLNRLLLSSDPFITSLRKLPRKKKSVLSRQVLNLLRI